MLWDFVTRRPRLTGRGTAGAAGGAPIWQHWVGRWSAAEGPEAADPAAWTRQTCATWLAALDRMNVGDYLHCATGMQERIDRLQASTKESHLAAIRRFCTDCQEWEWLPCRFDPNAHWRLHAASPRYPPRKPKGDLDDIWAKLLWAGLNLSHADLQAKAIGQVRGRIVGAVS